MNPNPNDLSSLVRLLDAHWQARACRQLPGVASRINTVWIDSPTPLQAIVAVLERWKTSNHGNTHLHVVARLPLNNNGIEPIAAALDVHHPVLVEVLNQPLVEGSMRLLCRSGTASVTLLVGDQHQSEISLPFKANFCWSDSAWHPYLPTQLIRHLDWGATVVVPNGCTFDDGTVDAKAQIKAFNEKGLFLVQDSNWAVDGPTHVDSVVSLPVTLQYRPPWAEPIRPSWVIGQHTTQQEPPPLQDVVVVGAGLAGACTAYAFAKRGFQVTVIDAADHAASGASGLPAGIVCPLVQANSPLALLTQAGCWISLQWCAQLLQEGQDFEFNGVLERLLRLTHPTAQRHHALAGWIKPKQLVQACLAHPLIRFLPGQALTGLQSAVIPPLNPSDADSMVAYWRLQVNDSLTPSLNARNLVIATASAANTVISLVSNKPEALPLTPVRGQVTLGRHLALAQSEQLASRPTNGWGHVLPNVPWKDDRYWMAGATYERNSLNLGRTDHDDTINRQKAARLLPKMADFFLHPDRQCDCEQWVGIRCTTPDRLPVLGALPQHLGTPGPGLLACIGLGSRGLSLAPLCAEVLASQLLGEPLPIPINLVKAMSAERFI